jgi:hypothetical protein
MSTDYIMTQIFPLRPDLDVDINLPRDLTFAEADRLGYWIRTLATALTRPEPTSTPPSSRGTQP